MVPRHDLEPGWANLRRRFGGRGGGSVLIATSDSTHSTFSELQLLMRRCKLERRLMLGVC